MNIDNITTLINGYQGVLLDAYGVFWAGNAIGLIHGAKEAMEHTVKSGKIVGILSNTTQLIAKEKDKLQKHGLIEGQHYHFLITSGDVTKQLFQQNKLEFPTPRKKFWIFGGIHPSYSSPLTLFEHSPFTKTDHLKDADFIYIGIPHIEGIDQTQPDIFREEVKKLLHTGLPMICANPDHFAQEGNPPRYVVRQGSIAALYESMGGKVFYIGKPHTQVYEYAMGQFKTLGVNNIKQVLMVGDTPETDIRGARTFGMPSALVTQTGVYHDRSSKEPITLDDLPDYFIPRFAL